jgi:hypothetical protein
LSNPNFALASITDSGQAAYFYVDIMRTVGNVVEEGVVGATLTPPSPSQQQASVPEPTTWALIIMGFGAVGAGLRARSRTAVVWRPAPSRLPRGSQPSGVTACRRVTCDASFPPGGSHVCPVV